VFLAGKVSASMAQILNPSYKFHADRTCWEVKYNANGNVFLRKNSKKNFCTMPMPSEPYELATYTACAAGFGGFIQKYLQRSS
jgi:hypothetical protein